MSADPKDGVLDPFCRTHDIPNLYVFGGNAFPSSGDKHPTLTMLALTARGCDHLLEFDKNFKASIAAPRAPAVSPLGMM